jgi:hypothetical protein
MGPFFKIIRRYSGYATLLHERSRRLTAGRACRGDVDIHDDIGDTVNGTGSVFGVFLDFRVTDAARELNDPVMYLNAN